MPLSLCNPRNLLFLDLSYNSLTGPVPRCLSDSLTVLNLHHNNLRSLPDTFSSSSLKMLDVGHNQISGKLPTSLVNCKSMKFVNVESNRFNDTFPFWLKSLPNLQVLILRSNRFYGPIFSPQYPLTFSKLLIIDISGNMFDGSLPPSYFVNWTAAISSGLENNSQPLNHIGDSYYLGFHPSMSMNMKGMNLEMERILNIYVIIDFSGNRFGGEIPESIVILKSLTVLNLANNSFTGHIPSSLANLSYLDSLDISRNQLSGTIPQELAKLYVVYVNMSYNKLTGQIPQSRRFLDQPESAFKGNIDLCFQESCFRGNVSSTYTTSNTGKAIISCFQT